MSSFRFSVFTFSDEELYKIGDLNTQRSYFLILFLISNIWKFTDWAFWVSLFLMFSDPRPLCVILPWALFVFFSTVCEETKKKKRERKNSEIRREALPLWIWSNSISYFCLIFAGISTEELHCCLAYGIRLGTQLLLIICCDSYLIFRPVEFTLSSILSLGQDLSLVLNLKKYIL